MKQTLPFLASAFLAACIISCTGQREIQMDMTDVQLVKIDTIQRYPYSSEKILTWRDENNIDYVTFVPVEMYYPLGARIKVMLKR